MSGYEAAHHLSHSTICLRCEYNDVAMRRTIQTTLLTIILFTPACKQAAEPMAATDTPLSSQTRIPPAVSQERRTPTVVAVHSVLPSVVNIQTESRMRRREVDPWFGFFGPPREYSTQSLGSGFVWAKKGVIVTNAHVIEGASRVMVVFQDGRQMEAKVIGADPDNDLAVLRIEADDLESAQLGTSSDLLIGETVIAVGNPFGLSGTVTTGVVSATGRSVPSKEQGRTFTDFIQTDASINPGNSGGPLLNIEGKVIGINVAIYAEAQGIGFAIPVDRAKKIVDDLLRYGEVHSAWIGAITATLTPEESQRLGLKASRGALVSRVFGGSPADRAGLRPGDVIVEVGKTPVDSREAFSTVTATASSGRPITLKVAREERTVDVTVTPSDAPSDLGLQILQAICGIDVADRSGSVVIIDVAPGSRASRMGLEPGDRIVGINGTEIATKKRINELVTRGSDRTSIVLYVARGRYIYTLTFPMGS